ncbi:MAG TPA: hypothetical protein VKI62_00075 [Bacteroidota bacterium]|nr:hypothetical protein [Bacteroidota bacterium]
MLFQALILHTRMGVTAASRGNTALGLRDEPRYENVATAHFTAN